MAEKNTSTLLILTSYRCSGRMAQLSEGALVRWRKLGCNWVPTPACLLPFFFSFIFFLPFGFLLFILTADPVSFARFCENVFLVIYFFSLSECQNYGGLNSYTRKITYSYGSYCDSGIGPGWFRFEGSAGTRMTTLCPPGYRCGTHATGWLNGGHPTVADGQVSRQVCFHYSQNCCHWSTNIKVRNCGSYYVYYLNGTPNCSLRYCGTN